MLEVYTTSHASRNNLFWHITLEYFNILQIAPESVYLLRYVPIYCLVSNTVSASVVIWTPRFNCVLRLVKFVLVTIVIDRQFVMGWDGTVYMPSPSSLNDIINLIYEPIWCRSKVLALH